MVIEIELDLEYIASEINGMVDREVETEETVFNWVRDNHTSIRLSPLKKMLQEALIERLAEVYE